VIDVVVNEVSRRFAGGCLAELLGELSLPAKGVAVAVNGEVVRRVDWTSHRLADGDVVDVLTAAQGG
jgi:sulfur carrier protein